MNWKQIIAGFAALALAMNALGFYTGRWSSPRYDDEAGAYAYLASEVRYEFNERGLRSLELHSGLEKYTYNVDKDTLDVSLRSAWELKNLTRQRNRILELDRLLDYVGLASLLPSGVAGAIIAIRSGTSQPPLLSRMAGTGSRVVVRVYLPAVTIGASAGYLGYKIGYSDVADWENEAMQKVLNEKRYYRQISNDLLVCELNGYDLANKVRKAIESLRSMSTIDPLYYHLRAVFIPSKISSQNGSELNQSKPETLNSRNNEKQPEFGSNENTGASHELIEYLNSAEFAAALEGINVKEEIYSVETMNYCEELAEYITEIGYDHPLSRLF